MNILNKIKTLCSPIMENQLQTHITDTTEQKIQTTQQLSGTKCSSEKTGKSTSKKMRNICSNGSRKKKQRKIRTTKAIKRHLKTYKTQYRGWTDDEIRAYRHWIYMKKIRDQRLGTSDVLLDNKCYKKQNKENKVAKKIDRDYRFFWRYFRSGESPIWESRYSKLAGNCITHGKRFAAFTNRLMKVVDKYGTLEEQQSVKDKYNNALSAFNDNNVMGK